MDALKNALSIVPSGTAATIIVGHALLTKCDVSVWILPGHVQPQHHPLTMKSTPEQAWNAQEASLRRPSLHASERPVRWGMLSSPS